MPHEGGPDGNIVNAIEKMDQRLTASIERQTEAIERMEQRLGDKIDGQTEVLQELVRINTGVLKVLERADIKIAD